MVVIGIAVEKQIAKRPNRAQKTGNNRKKRKSPVWHVERRRSPRPLLSLAFEESGLLSCLLLVLIPHDLHPVPLTV